MSDYIKTIPGQIQHLKELGLIVPDDGKAHEILSDIGYYRLGFYMYPFERKYPAKTGRDHVFRDGVSLDTVLRLYYFDFELRQILLKYISRIEIHLRTTIVNYMSAKHHNNDTWFSDNSIVASGYARTFDGIYERVRLSPYIRWHHHNHACKYAPAWKTIEFMTMGEIVDLYNAINNTSSRLDICRTFGLRSIKTFDNYLSSVRRLRNRCAHGGVLFDYIAGTSLTNQGPVDLSRQRDRITLCGAIRVIEYLIGTISANRRSDMEQDLQRLLDSCKDDDALYLAIQIASGLK